MESYDFIIIGGGTAGLVLATRLSETPSHSILVLEAGTDHSEDPRVKTPAFWSALRKTEVDWGFETEPQAALNGRTITLNQGKALGGSSITNAQIFNAPTKDTIDAWATLGNKGWDWNGLRGYYTKTCTFPSIPDNLRKGLGIDGCTATDDTCTGPIKLSFPGNPHHPLREAWANTFKATGHFMTDDPWADASVGSFSNLANIDPEGKERIHAVNAYYSPIKGRENLHVLTNAEVERVLFKDGSAEAIGVQYRFDNDTKIVSASKEVIVAAGALQSPKLLELSGIGNTDMLNRHGINTVKDLPGVGENLQDHVWYEVGFEAVDDLDTLDALARQDAGALEQAMQTGLLTTSGMLAFAQMPVFEHLSEEGRESLKILLQQNRPSTGNAPEQFEARSLAIYEIAAKALLNPNQPSAAYLSALGQSPVALDPTTGKPFPPLPGKHLTLATILAHPLSRGTVHIRSNDVSDAPLIDPRYFTNNVDVEAFAEHILHLHTIASAPAMSRVLKRPAKLSRPASHHLAGLDAAKERIRSLTGSMWHPAGTCAMLPEELGGVVDTELKVYGTKGLRVVDSSIVPLLPPGNLQSTVYAVAEKAADLIKEEYGVMG